MMWSRINSMYVDSSDCVRVKWIKSEWFRIDCGMIQVWIMSPWLFNVYMGAVKKEVKMRMERGRSEILGGWERVEISWPLVCT